ncbi:MAG: hypothetical protein QOF02_2302 [Blastocatellia bacterium]|jgi:hypothetical protein|nr:hypothetical protein [Blastocatellia bacterium]
MNSTQTNQDSQQRARRRVGQTRAILALLSLLVVSFSAANDAFAQKGFSRKYPTRKNVRLQLSNLFGTVTVETWNRDEIKVSADMYPPVAPFTPEQTEESLIINVKNESRGRGDVGDINFRITVPVNSSVDIETRRGNITVRGVQGAMVRAKVYGSGEIELSEIGASRVMAETITGNIFYDGRLAEGGKYEFETVKGDVTIRLPGDSAFSLMAAAPSTRKINLGMFANPGLNLGDGRKVYGNVGDGRCSLTILNQQGSITLVRR